MKLQSSIIKVIENTLNYVDPRLMNHGKRVAYLMYKILSEQNEYSAKEISHFVALGLLHDIGAYKTEDIDKLLDFETKNVWEHSVYGYLFIKHFSPLSHLAPVLLFHHASLAELTHLHPKFHKIAQLLYIADRFDVLSQTGQKMPETFKRHFTRRSGETFDPELLPLFFKDGWTEFFDGMEEDKKFHHALYEGEYTDDEMRQFLDMIVLSIDFRSPQTVTHTFTSACVCKALLNYLDVDPREADFLETSVMMHDLGKIGIPLSILEKQGRLTETEMETMRKHVTITCDILEGHVENDCLNLSIRHHEKLDGSGYPLGLTATDLTLGQRMVATTDIFSALIGVRSYKTSYPEEKVGEIMNEMADKGLIDQHIVNVIMERFHEIMDAVDTHTRPIIELYETMKATYATLLPLTAGFATMPGRGEIEK